LSVLVDGSGGHIEQTVIPLGQFVIEQTHALVNVVGLQLSHHVRTSDGPVNVRNNHLRILLPQEDLELSLLEHPRRDLEDKFGLVLARTQSHALEELVVWCFAVSDDFLLFQSSRGREASGRLLFDVQLGHIITPEYSEPALLGLCPYDLVY
jgi:hypothetical protein